MSLKRLRRAYDFAVLIAALVLIPVMIAFGVAMTWAGLSDAMGRTAGTAVTALLGVFVVWLAANSYGPHARMGYGGEFPIPTFFWATLHIAMLTFGIGMVATIEGMLLGLLTGNGDVRILQAVQLLAFAFAFAPLAWTALSKGASEATATMHKWAGRTMAILLIFGIASILLTHLRGA
jgi:hypothetical protein